MARRETHTETEGRDGDRGQGRTAEVPTQRQRRRKRGKTKRAAPRLAQKRKDGEGGHLIKEAPWQARWGGGGGGGQLGVQPNWVLQEVMWDAHPRALASEKGERRGVRSRVPGRAQGCSFAGTFQATCT